MKRNRILTALAFILVSYLVTAQENILNTYIQRGLESNLALQQIQDDYKMSLQALRSARGLFYPNLSFDARYTVASGGRVIDFPVGTLLNPIYSTLNQLTETNNFTMLENQEIPFYRPHEQETKLSLVQPVFNPKIIYNNQIQKEKVAIKRTDISIYQRELIKEIKAAYFSYVKTVSLLQLIDETKVLLQENLRVSNSLYENDKVTIDVVYRSESQLQNLELKHAEAEKSNKMAGAYFNFLLNKPLTDTIEIMQEETHVQSTILTDLDQQVKTGLSNREEMIQLSTYLTMNGKYEKLLRSSNYPAISFVMNYGFQGEEYSFTGNDDFVMASVVLQWTLFEGFKNRADVQQTKITSHQLELKRTEAEKQIQLEIINACYDLQAAGKAIDAANAQVESSEKAFRVINEKYRNGQASLIEFIDAQTNMTSSKQNLIIAKADYKIKEAELERVLAEKSIR
jgi:outer membrane protein